ncbi:MAG: cyclic nucleotide-binding domain-containing protein [Deltaproteobacteria bacterium]|nr:cyclic nucleotide-binding domain-containing protein [Deltaproteobacteria bacterium]
MKKSRFFKESKLRKYKDKASDLIEKGKYEKALAIYRDILEAFPQDTTIMLKIGDLCKKLKMIPEAVAVYSTAAEHHAQTGRLLQAIAVCRLILEIDNSHSATQKKLAALYAQKYGSSETSGVLTPESREQPEKAPEKSINLNEGDLQKGVEQPETQQARIARIQLAARHVKRQMANRFAAGAVVASEEQANAGATVADACAGAPLPTPETPPPVTRMTPIAEEALRPIRPIVERGVQPVRPTTQSRIKPPRPVIEKISTPVSLPTPVTPPVVDIPAPESDIPEVPVFLPDEDYQSSESNADVSPRTAITIPVSREDTVLNEADNIYENETAQEGAEDRPARKSTGPLRLDFTQIFQDDEEPSAVYEQADLDEYLAELQAEGLTDDVEEERGHRPGEHGRPAAQRNLVLTISKPAPPPAVLPTIPLFSSMNEMAFFDLVNELPLRKFDAVETVVEEGEYGDSFFIIVSGSVEIFKGGESIATLEEGAFFGEMAMLFPGPRQATVVTTEPCELFEVSNSQLEELMHRYPRVGQRLLEFAEERLLNNLLKTSPLFAPFCDADRQSLMEKFEPYLIDAGTVIIQEGEHANGLYLIVIGHVCVVMRGDHGEDIVVEHLKGNDIFGEVCLLSHQRAVATVRAEEQTRVLVLPREQFNELIMTHPQVLELLSASSEARIRHMNEIRAMHNNASSD